MSPPTSLVARRVATSLPIDGTLTHPAWQWAQRSPRFVDMATGSPALLDTQAAVLWDEEYLYVGFWVEDPQPTAHLTERDSIIFTENDVEVFIDGGDCYYELELNARNTLYEVFFIWRDAYRRGGRFDIPEFDLHEQQPLTFAGDFDRRPESFWKGTHPRGVRWAFLNWDMPGLKSATHVSGILNDPGAKSQGWTAEIAIPWKSLQHLANGRSIPPMEGDVWKLFLGRFQNIPIGEGKVNAAWCVTPHGLYDTHQPEKFTEVRFTSESN